MQLCTFNKQDLDSILKFKYHTFYGSLQHMHIGKSKAAHLFQKQVLYTYNRAHLPLEVKSSGGYWRRSIC